MYCVVVAGMPTPGGVVWRFASPTSPTPATADSALDWQDVKTMTEAYPSRVWRGGSWFLPTEFHRATFRYGLVPGGSNTNLGFRIAKGVSDRVLRGGCWYDVAWFCRSAYRDLFGPVVSIVNVGFRMARSTK